MVADIQIVSSDDAQSHQKSVIDDLILAQQRINNKTKMTSTSTGSKPLTSSKQVMVHNPKEYWNSCIIMNPDINNNFYFKWLNHDKASWIMNVVTNQWYYVGAVILFMLIYGFAYWGKVTYGSQSMLFILPCVVSAVVELIGIVSIVFTMNLDIIKMIENSFDFWFKMWNLIIWEVCFIWISIHRNRSSFDLITIVSGTFILYISIFLVDAIPAEYNIKRKVLTLFVFIFSGMIMMTFFRYENVYFNPFASYNFELTNISVKDSLLGAYWNILLFVAKPLITDTCRWLLVVWLRCTSKCYTKNRDVKNTNASVKGIERFVSLYKRSKVKW